MIVFLLSILSLFLFTIREPFNIHNLYTDIEVSEAGSSQLSVLNQPYSFLGEGAQMYAFLSQDGMYVLKLFKAKHQRPFKISRLKRTAKEWEESRERWHQKFQSTARRYKMAYADLNEETGLIHLHLEKTNGPMPVILKGKKTDTIDLSHYPFILQKKALLVTDYFRKYPEKKKDAIASLKAFFVTRLDKGYSDPRQSLDINYGFIGDVPIQIDPGKIERFEGDKNMEIEKIHARLDGWASRR